MKKIANAYSIPYYSCNDISKLDETVNKTLNHDGYVMCEIFVDTKQEFEPKSASKSFQMEKWFQHHLKI